MRDSVTIQLAKITIIIAKITYPILTSAKKRFRKEKYIPPAAIKKAKEPEIVRVKHKRPPAGLI